MASGDVYRTHTADSIDWGKVSGSINVTVDAFQKFGWSAEEAARAIEQLNHTLGNRSEERERKRRTVKAMRPFMDVLTDPQVLLLRRWVDVERPLYVDGNRALVGDYMDVDPNWLVTIGVAVNIETREIEFWMSSPTSTLCWFIDPALHGSIDHLTTGTTGILTSQTLEAKWIEVLADLAESDGGFRFTNDPKPLELTERERDAVKRGRESGIMDIYREAQVIDQWVKPEDWSEGRGLESPPPFAPGSPPGTYTLSSGDNYFSTIMDSVTSTPDPDETLTIEKMMDLSKQLKDAKINHKKNNEYFSILDINTTA